MLDWLAPTLIHPEAAVGRSSGERRLVKVDRGGNGKLTAEPLVGRALRRG
ncbi:hypothetical protein LQK93_01956 [Terrabacter sp. BE26]